MFHYGNDKLREEVKILLEEESLPSDSLVEEGDHSTWYNSAKTVGAIGFGLLGAAGVAALNKAKKGYVGKIQNIVKDFSADGGIAEQTFEKPEVINALLNRIKKDDKTYSKLEGVRANKNLKTGMTENEIIMNTLMAMLSNPGTFQLGAINSELGALNLSDIEQAKAEEEKAEEHPEEADQAEDLDLTNSDIRIVPKDAPGIILTPDDLFKDKAGAPVSEDFKAGIETLKETVDDGSIYTDPNIMKSFVTMGDIVYNNLSDKTKDKEAIKNLIYAYLGTDKSKIVFGPTSLLHNPDDMPKEPEAQPSQPEKLEESQRKYNINKRTKL
jgi:hypothetical protein